VREIIKRALIAEGRPWDSVLFSSRVSMTRRCWYDISAARMCVCRSVRHVVVLCLNECACRQSFSLSH